jgi:hypothetical protein
MPTVYVLKHGPGGGGADLFSSPEVARDYANRINEKYDVWPMIWLDPEEQDGKFYQRAEDLRGITRFYLKEQAVHDTADSVPRPKFTPTEEDIRS